ncbi:MAG: DUF2062 domain-containing protein [Gammaproteobacteria bacterium]|nr:DUF2062 domain-containing protein [Gammaproteobacteria bacterium]
MPYRRYLPSREQVRSIRALRFLGEVVFEPNLWHFNRHSVSFALFVGLFCAFLPIPFQMVVAVIGCIWIRCNIPISIALVWISNPLTMPAIFFATYKFGTWILGQPDQVSRVNLSFEWLSAQLSVVWAPLLLGSLIAGLLSGSLAFIIARLWWRWRVSKEWSKRREARRRLVKTTRNGAPQPDADEPPAMPDTESRRN